MLRRPLCSAAGIRDGWIKAGREPHHTTCIHTALFMMRKVDSSGLTSCTHRTYIGPDRRWSSGVSLPTCCAALWTQSFVKCKAMLVLYDTYIEGIMSGHALLFS